MSGVGGRGDSVCRRPKDIGNEDDEVPTTLKQESGAEAWNSRSTGLEEGQELLGKWMVRPCWRRLALGPRHGPLDFGHEEARHRFLSWLVSRPLSP